MYSCLKIREPLNGFLSVPLQGKFTVCKSTIHHPKSLVLYGAFGEDGGCGHERADRGDKSSAGAAVGGPRLGRVRL